METPNMQPMLLQPVHCCLLSSYLLLCFLCHISYNNTVREWIRFQVYNAIATNSNKIIVLNLFHYYSVILWLTRTLKTYFPLFRSSRKAIVKLMILKQKVKRSRLLLISYSLTDLSYSENTAKKGRSTMLKNTIQ